MLRIFITALLVILVAAPATAQTATQPTTTRTNGGAFDKLSPGNQKIAQSLFDAQPSGSPTPMSRDDIAAMKQGGKGWGEVFKEMKSQGLVREKNLGQVVSKYGQRPQPGVSNGTTNSTGSSRSQGEGNKGKPELGGKPGKGHSNDTADPGRGYGQGRSSQPGASAGRSGASQGGGKGK